MEVQHTQTNHQKILKFTETSLFNTEVTLSDDFLRNNGIHAEMINNSKALESLIQ